VFSTYDQGYGWFAGDDPSLFGGVRPSVWGDGNGVASQMSSDKDVLRTLFTQKGYGGKNAVVAADQWYYYSSTNSKHAAALFRVKNVTPYDIAWTVNVRMTSYGSWSEARSVALNGVSAFSDTSSSGSGASSTPATVTLSVPANRTSTVIFVAGSGPNTGSPTRSLLLAFVNNCLALPAGLTYVDDLDTATGGWDQ
jgi:hypothetical protein